MREASHAGLDRLFNQHLTVMISDVRLYLKANTTRVIINYYFLIFSFLISGVKAKRGIVFHHSTRKLKHSAESGERSVLPLGSLSTPLYRGCIVKVIIRVLFIYRKFTLKKIGVCIGQDARYTGAKRLRVAGSNIRD